MDKSNKQAGDNMAINVLHLRVNQSETKMNKYLDFKEREANLKIKENIVNERMADVKNKFVILNKCNKEERRKQLTNKSKYMFEHYMKEINDVPLAKKVSTVNRKPESNVVEIKDKLNVESRILNSNKKIDDLFDNAVMELGTRLKRALSTEEPSDAWWKDGEEPLLIAEDASDGTKDASIDDRVFGKRKNRYRAYAGSVKRPVLLCNRDEIETRICGIAIDAVQSECAIQLKEPNDELRNILVHDKPQVNKNKDN